MSCGVDDAQERRKVFDLALSLWQDGDRLRQLREKLGLSRSAVTRLAKISIHRLESYERPGEVVGNFWHFCKAMEVLFRQLRITSGATFLLTAVDLIQCDSQAGSPRLSQSLQACDEVGGTRKTVRDKLEREIRRK